MLDHVSLPVSDVERSKRFYVEALSPLGYELIMEHHISGVGFRQSGKPDFWIRQGVPGNVIPGFAPSTIRPTMGPSSSIRWQQHRSDLP